MPPWMEYLVSGLIGALGMGITMTFKIGNRVTRMEARLDDLEDDFKAERTRTDARIFELAGMMKEVMAQGRAILANNATLVTTAEVLIRELREGRRGQ